MYSYENALLSFGSSINLTSGKKSVRKKKKYHSQNLLGGGGGGEAGTFAPPPPPSHWIEPWLCILKCIGSHETSLAATHVQFGSALLHYGSADSLLFAKEFLEKSHAIRGKSRHSSYKRMPHIRSMQRISNPSDEGS